MPVLSPFIEWLLKFVFVDVIYPIALNIAVRRETDPKFKAESDQVYGQYKAASTTADRKTFARKIYELQKSQ
jgi:hypothetical protein